MSIDKAEWYKYNAEFRIAHGMILPGDPPLQQMTIYRSSIEKSLMALGYNPLALLERANVEAATGSPRIFCYVGAVASDGKKIAFKLNLSVFGADVVDEKVLLEHIRNAGKWHAVSWDGVTPLDVALQVEWK